MKKISSYLTNYIAPSSGYSEGQLKDDPGDGSGSGATVYWANDIMYGMLAIAKKWIGVISDTDESESASDILNSIERMAGVQNENVSAYNNSTTYAQDDHVMYLGVQYVSMVAANTGNNPMDNPVKWLPCFERNDAMVKWRNGEPLSGGFEKIHNHRDAGYRPYFKWGKYNFGGDAGRNFQATGIHLDGTVLTGTPALVALFDIGGAHQYHLLDVIAPDVVGIRTLLNTKGRVARSVDGTGGSTAIVGAAQEDQFQGHYHIPYFATGGGAGSGIYSATGDSAYTQGLQPITNELQIREPSTDGTNQTPRTGAETRMKNYTKGVDFIILMQEI
jgi:hypothetical protein